jgi:hypothetical protein
MHSCEQYPERVREEYRNEHSGQISSVIMTTSLSANWPDANAKKLLVMADAMDLGGVWCAV